MKYFFDNEGIFVIEKLIMKIAETQAFLHDDKLGRMVKEYKNDELDKESLDQVYAARKDDVSYDAFLKLAQKRGSGRK